MGKLVMLTAGVIILLVWFVLYYLFSSSFRGYVNERVKCQIDDFTEKYPRFARAIRAFLCALFVGVLSERLFIIIWLNLIIFLVAFVGFWIWLKPKQKSESESIED